MAGYSFAEESDIRRIIRSVLATERDLLSRPTRKGTWHMPGAVQVYAARVNDAGGIAACAGVTPGSGTVDVYEIVDGTLTAVAAMAGITAYNSSASVIADDAWVVITRDPYTGSWSIVQLQGSNVTQTLLGYVYGAAIAARTGTQMVSQEVQVWESSATGGISDTGDTVVAWNVDEYQSIDSTEFCLLHWEPYGSVWLAKGWEPPAGAGTTEVTAVIDVDYASGELRSTQQVLTVSAVGATSTNSIFQADTVTVLNDVDFVSGSFNETHQTLTVLEESATASSVVFTTETETVITDVDYSDPNFRETHKTLTVFDSAVGGTATVFAAVTAELVEDVDYTDSAARFWQTKKTVTLLAAGSAVTSTWESGTTC